MLALPQLLARRTPPREFQAWTRLILLLASLWNSAFGIVLLVSVAHTAWPARALAAVGLACLGYTTVRAHRRRRFAAWQPLVDGLAIGVALWSLGDLRLGVVLIYQGLFFRPTYGPRWESLTGVLSYGGAFIAAVAAPLALGQPAPLSVPEIVSHLLGLAVFGLVKLALTVMSGVQQRAMIREQTLAKAGAGLVAAVDRAEVHAVTLDAVQRILAAAQVTRTALSMIEGDSCVVVACVGEQAEAVLGRRQDLTHVPAEYRTRGVQTKQITVDAQVAAQLEQMTGLRPHLGTLTITPLRVKDEFLGLIVVESLQPLPAECRAGLATLSAEVALALQSAQLTENLQRRVFEDPLTHL